jgi:peptide/nickel transport system substrate-binding protein
MDMGSSGMRVRWPRRNEKAVRRAFSRRPLSVAMVAILGLALAACTNSAGGQGSGSQSSKTVTFAEQPGSTPNFIFPLLPPSNCTTANLPEFEYMMWRPLVWLGHGQQLTIDSTKSMYSAMTYGNKSVTITLKNEKWSDGTAITSRDLAFYINLVKANAVQDCWYVPTAFPQDIVSYKIVNTHTIVLNLDRNYSHQWFTWNELSSLSPIPQHAWDKTSASGAVGNQDLTPSGAKAVFSYLVSQSKDLGTYATNPLWKVVDGPWKLSAYTSTGQATFVPNPQYSGADKAKVAKLVELPFTSDAAEFAALQSGQVDVGYLPPSDVKTIGRLKSNGYQVTGQDAWGIAYYVPNLGNPTVGPILRQTYIRQALEMLVPQDQLIKTIYSQYAYPTQGPVPLQPDNPFTSAYEKNYPYRFNVSAAEKLLTGHGWSVSSHGADRCIRPGSAANQCGAGIAANQTLTFSFLYNSSDFSISNQAQILKSVAGQAGVVLNLKGEPADTVFATGACPSDCSWQLLDYGRDGYSGIPSGETMFLPGATSNAGDYSDPTTTNLINQTLYSNDPSAMGNYQNYVAAQLPWIWLPNADGSVTVVNGALKGVIPQNVFNLFNPEDWSY